MSIHMMNRVWRESSAKGSQLLLLLAVADFADDDGIAWPGIDALARKTRLSRRQTQYNIQALIQSGELEMIDPGGSGAKDTNKYRVTPDKGAKIAPCKDSRVQSATNKGATDGQIRVQPIAPDPSLTISDPSLGADAPKPETESPKKTKRASTVPQDFELSERVLTWASKTDNNFTREQMESQIPEFVDHHTAKGTAFKDWDAAFQNWMRRARRYGTLTTTPDGSMRVYKGGRANDAPVERPDLFGAERREYFKNKWIAENPEEAKARGLA